MKWTHVTALEAMQHAAGRTVLKDEHVGACVTVHFSDGTMVRVTAESLHGFSEDTGEIPYVEFEIGTP